MRRSRLGLEYVGCGAVAKNRPFRSLLADRDANVRAQAATVIGGMSEMSGRASLCRMGVRYLRAGCAGLRGDSGKRSHHLTPILAPTEA